MHRERGQSRDSRDEEAGREGSQDAKGNPKGGKTQTNGGEVVGKREQMTQKDRHKKPEDRREKVHSEGVSTPETAD